METTDEISGSRYYLSLGSRLTKLGNFLFALVKNILKKVQKQQSVIQLVD